jgi:16S rRNA (guanine966-N2)-methyltransferase
VTRIVAGELRGRRIRLPTDRRVRPTSDRVREAWLSILGPWITDARVLDLFAGSGALGLEALSRGARSVTFVDLNQASVDAITENLAALGLGDRARVIRRDVLRFLASRTREPVEVAFADPPYGLGLAGKTAERFLADPFARVLGIEHSAKEAMPAGDTRWYGDTALTFYHAL